MAFSDLLIHTVNTYDPTIGVTADNYNTPVATKSTTSGIPAVKCRLQTLISKEEGFTQSEIELIEEVPVTLFIDKDWIPTNSNYVLGIDVGTGEKNYLIRRLNVKYDRVGIHHYELEVVPSSIY